MTEYAGWCPSCGPLTREQLRFTMCADCSTCGCTGPGADAALQAMRERDELRAETEDALGIVSDDNPSMDRFTRLVPTVRWLLDKWRGAILNWERVEAERDEAKRERDEAMVQVAAAIDAVSAGGVGPREMPLPVLITRMAAKMRDTFDEKLRFLSERDAALAELARVHEERDDLLVGRDELKKKIAGYDLGGVHNYVHKALFDQASEERDAAFDRGRAVGREDIGKYSNAIGRIESALGIAGGVPMEQTIHAVESLIKERDELARAHGGHLPTCGGMDEIDHRCDCGYLQGEAYREIIRERDEAREDARKINDDFYRLAALIQTIDPDINAQLDEIDDYDDPDFREMYDPWQAVRNAGKFIDRIRTAMRAQPDSDLVSLAETLAGQSGAYDTFRSDVSRALCGELRKTDVADALAHRVREMAETLAGYGDEIEELRAALEGVTSTAKCQFTPDGERCKSHLDFKECPHGIARRLLGWDK